MYLARASSMAAIALTIFPAEYVRAQSAPGAPPAVGIVEAARRQITESSEFLGRIEAVNRVNIVARVTAFMEARLFTEGAEVKKGDRCIASSGACSRPILRRNKRKSPNCEPRSTMPN